jgi:Skp family chaperone for outer membrane proteins
LQAGEPAPVGEAEGGDLREELHKALQDLHISREAHKAKVADLEQQIAREREDARGSRERSIAQLAAAKDQEQRKIDALNARIKASAADALLP